MFYTETRADGLFLINDHTIDYGFAKYNAFPTMVNDILHKQSTLFMAGLMPDGTEVSDDDPKGTPDGS